MAELIYIGMIAGFASSLISSLFGGGSGLITVPIFYWLFAQVFPQQSTHWMQMTLTTGACTAVPLGIVASIGHIRHGNIDRPALTSLFFPMLFGGAMATIAILILHSHVLKMYFSIVVFWVAIWTYWYRPGRHAWKRPTFRIKTIAAGVAALSVSLGVSIFSVPFFLRLGLPIKKAIGSSTIVVFAYSAISAILLLLMGLKVPNLPRSNLGYLNLPVFFSAILPCMLGSWAGIKIVTHFPQSILRYGFILLMLSVAIVMAIPS